VLKDAGKVVDCARFVLIELNEPPKEKMLAYRPEQALARRAFVVLYYWDSNTTSEDISFACPDVRGASLSLVA